MARGVDAITMLLKQKTHDGLGGLFYLKLGYARGDGQVDISRS
jgi:hypothetical protein